MWSLGGPVRQRGAQAGKGKADWSQVALKGAGLVVAEVPNGVLGRGVGRVKEGLKARARL